MRRSPTRAGVVAGALALLAGLASGATRDVAAVLTQPTPQSRAELLRVVRRALHGAAVRIADDALTTDDVLIIERAAHRDARGLPLDGRERGRPERFRLVKSGSRCVLVHEGSGRRFRLSSATCSPR